MVLRVKIEKKVVEKPIIVDVVKSIVVEQPKDIVIENNRPSEEIYDSFVFQCQVDELKNAYNLRGFDDKDIKKATIEAKGDVDMTFQILMGKK